MEEEVSTEIQSILPCWLTEMAQGSLLAVPHAGLEPLDATGCILTAFGKAMIDIPVELIGRQ
jgi:hypothetical protein